MSEPATARPLIAPRLVEQKDEEEQFSAMDRRVEDKPRRRRWLFIGVGAAALLGILVALYVRYALTRSVVVREASVVISPVRQAEFTEYVPATAVVVPRTTVYLDAVEGGQVAEVMVEEGAFVTR